MKFLEKLQELNDIMVDLYMENIRDPDTMYHNLEKAGIQWEKLMKYYDTNKYDLNIIEMEYQEFQIDWVSFAEMFNYCCGQALTAEQQSELGIRLQRVKDSLEKLIIAVREKY